MNLEELFITNNRLRAKLFPASAQGLFHLACEIKKGGISHPLFLPSEIFYNAIPIRSIIVAYNLFKPTQVQPHCPNNIDADPQLQDALTKGVPFNVWQKISAKGYYPAPHLPGSTLVESLAALAVNASLYDQLLVSGVYLEKQPESIFYFTK